MKKSILVPLDGSNEAEGVLSQVRRIASPRDVVHFLHVMPPLHAPVGLDPTHVLALEEQSSAYLSAVRDRWMPDQEGLDFVRTGNPAEGILTLALEKNIDLIAMTTHGRSGMSQWFLGSVALEVVRKTQLPVLLTRPEMPLSSSPIRRILVSLDGREAAHDLLETVKSLAAGPRATIVLYHAEPTGPDPAPPWPDPIPVSQLLSPAHRLEQLADTLASEGYSARPVVSAGDPAAEILAHAAKLKVDLVALATHGRTGLGRILEGSVAEAVLRQSPVAVLLQKPLVVHQPALQGEPHA
ncbi:MAG TPA: universal stress protein [Planctomycetota bacterium]|nr:universal stress protein [Planctomycetota bacterium]